MLKVLAMILTCVVSLSSMGQSTSSKYQPGTIMAVNQHHTAAGADSSVVRYDVSMKVGNTLYVVLYTPPPGTYGAQYSAGYELLVLVGSKTITFNDLLGNSRTVPILSRKTVTPQSNR